MTVVVLVLAGGAGWESGALARLQERRDIVVLRRCVDVDDLLAAAGSGQADVAVVGLEADGLDRPAVDHLRHHGVRPVAVVACGPGARPGRAARQSDRRAGRRRATTTSAALPDARARRRGAGADDGPRARGRAAAGRRVGPRRRGLGPGRCPGAHHGRGRDRRRARGPRAAHGARRRRPLRRGRGPAARRPRRGLGAALRGPRRGRGARCPSGSAGSRARWAAGSPS